MRRAALERLHRHTGGNPLFATALLREHGVERLSSRADPLPTPQGYAAHIAGVLERCDVATRRLVTALAVLGGRAALADLAALAEIPDPLARLDAAVGAGLVRVAGTPPIVEFAHALVRAAVADTALRSLAAALHRRAAALVGESDEIAHLVAAADGPDAALFARAAASAAAGAAGGDPAAAGHALLGALGVAVPAQRGRGLLDAVRLLLLGGAVADGAAFEAEIAALPPSPRCDAVLGQLALLAGRIDAAEPLLIAAWKRRTSPEDDDLIPSICLGLSHLNVVAARGEEAARWARTGLQAPGTPPEISGLLAARIGLGLSIAGRIDEALGELDALLAGRATSSPVGPSGLHGRGCARLWSDDLDGAAEDLATAAAGLPVAAPDRVAGLGYLAETEFRRGR